MEDRRNFLGRAARLIPGVGNIQDANETKNGYGENPPTEVEDEINKLRRRGFLKLGLTLGGAFTVTGISLYVRNLVRISLFKSKIKENKAIETAIWKTLSDNVSESVDRLQNTQDIDNYLAENGEITNYHPHPADERTMIMGFNSRGKIPGTIKVNDEEIKVEIDTDNLAITPVSEKKVDGKLQKTLRRKTTPFKRNIAAGENYITKNGITTFELKIPVTYTQDGNTTKKDFIFKYEVLMEYTKEKETKALEDIKQQVDILKPENPDNLSEKMIKTLGNLIDNAGNFQCFTCLPLQEATFHLGEKVIILGGPKVFEGVTSEGYNFSVSKQGRAVFLDGNNKEITHADFENNIIMSCKHLLEKGLKKIRLLFAAKVQINEATTSSPILIFEYDIADSSLTLDKTIQIKTTNGNTINITPENESP